MTDTGTLTQLPAHRVFGRTLGDFLRSPLFPVLGLTSDDPIRLEEFTDDGHLVVCAELPCVDPEKDIQVPAEDALLTIRGERRNEIEYEARGRHFSEMRYGLSSRTIPFPWGAARKM
jgi:HSP20 family molecular chaperone IbpA